MGGGRKEKQKCSRKSEFVGLSKSRKRERIIWNGCAIENDASPVGPTIRALPFVRWKPSSRQRTIHDENDDEKKSETKIWQHDQSLSSELECQVKRSARKRRED